MTAGFDYRARRRASASGFAAATFLRGITVPGPTRSRKWIPRLAARPVDLPGKNRRVLSARLVIDECAHFLPDSTFADGMAEGR
ncbi:MAG: hypothetical protein ACLSDM_09075 [Butyricicoccus sp.]